MAIKEKRVPKANGRPRKVLSKEDAENVVKLAGIMASWDEIASHIGWSKSTLEKNADAKEAYRIGMDNGRCSLKRAMFKNAIEGNATMQIWLSKIHLGYKEHQQVIATDGAALVSIGAFKGTE